MQPQHLLIAAALAEEHQADPVRQADRWRLVLSAWADHWSARPARRRWWWPAIRPARA